MDNSFSVQIVTSWTPFTMWGYITCLIDSEAERNSKPITSIFDESKFTRRFFVLGMKFRSNHPCHTHIRVYVHVQVQYIVVLHNALDPWGAPRFSSFGQSHVKLVRLRIPPGHVLWFLTFKLDHDMFGKSMLCMVKTAYAGHVRRMTGPPGEEDQHCTVCVSCGSHTVLYFDATVFNVSTATFLLTWHWTLLLLLPWQKSVSFRDTKKVVGYWALSIWLAVKDRATWFDIN